MEKNTRVNWVVRLISFKQNLEPELGIDRLSRLGPPKQLFSFVGSYDELVGYSVKEALEATGVKYTNGDRVSAIIFPLHADLFPANARGLLQVIQQVEARKDVDIKQKFFQGSNSLSNDEIKDLNDNNLESYQLKISRTNIRATANCHITSFATSHPIQRSIWLEAWVVTGIRLDFLKR